jgi:hypothetical protein
MTINGIKEEADKYKLVIQLAAFIPGMMSLV